MKATNNNIDKGFVDNHEQTLTCIEKTSYSDKTRRRAYYIYALRWWICWDDMPKCVVGQRRLAMEMKGYASYTEHQSQEWKKTVGATHRSRLAILATKELIQTSGDDPGCFLDVLPVYFGDSFQQTTEPIRMPPPQSCFDAFLWCLCRGMRRI